MAGSQENFKIWTASKDATAGMMVTPTSAQVIGSKYNFMVASKTGVSIMGKSITLGTTAENVRMGGLFVQMNDFVRMIPSTFTTPIPPQIPFPPLGMVTQILSDLPFFLAMMAS